MTCILYSHSGLGCHHHPRTHTAAESWGGGVSSLAGPVFIGSRKHRQKAALSSMALFAKWTTLSLVSLLGCQDWEGQACVPRYLRKVVSKKAASFVRSSSCRKP